MFQPDKQTGKSLLDALPAAVVSLDEGARIVALNPAAARLLETAVGEEMSLSKQCAARGHDPTRSILGALSRAGTWTGVVTFLTPAGHECEARARFARVEPDLASKLAGEPASPACLASKLACQRIVAIGALEPNEDWSQLRRRLAEADRCLAAGRMAAGIAHNLNNAMVGVMGYASMLKGMLEGDPKLSRFIGKVEASADRAASLIRQFLSFSQTGESQPVLLNLGDVVEIAAKLFIKSDLPRVKLAYEVAGGQPLLYGVPADIQQAINSLLHFIYRRAKGQTVSIHLSCRAVRGGDVPENPAAVSEAVWVSIASDCPWEEAAPPASLFDIHSYDEGVSPSFELPFAKEVVQAHQGWVVAGQAEGGGIRFDLYFPTRAALEAKDGQAPAARTGVPDLPGDMRASRPAKVLVIDDEELVLELVSDLLVQGGFEAVRAGGGYEGLQKATTMPDVDAVILDQSMPDMEGREVYEKLRETRPDLPVLISSGYNTDAMKTMFPADPRLDYIQKPYRFSQLIHAINKAIE